MTVAAEWEGGVGAVWAEEWRRTDRSFAGLSTRLDAAILAAAPPGPGVALDIGCGAGSTSLALAAARPDLAVTGIDIADGLVAVARERATGIANARFLVADLNHGVPPDAIPPGRAPDLMVSRHGVMFFDDPVRSLAALHAAAAPGAALVFSCFRAPALNPWASALVGEVTGAAPSPAPRAAPGPFGFADVDHVTDVLARAGWRDATPEPIDYRYVAGAGDDPLADAVAFFRRIGPVASALRAAPEDDRARLLDNLAAALQKRCEQGEVAFPAAAWIWRARASGAQGDSA